MTKELSSAPTAHISIRPNKSHSGSVSAEALGAWCRLIRDRRWGDAQKRALLLHFGSPQEILGASPADLNAVVGVRPPTKEPNLESGFLDAMVAADLRWLAHADHHLISINCRAYPALLKQIVDPPIALFAIGNLALLSEPQIAIVGSRRPTPVGAQVARRIAGDLSKLGIVITSGMALGIDGIAHSACVEQGEASIAVLGSGLDIIYPARNRKLFEKLTAYGLILSEYPLGVPPDRYTFPKRNRIVSGLSYGVVIVEAAERSGTLITARLSLEHNRELMVVPGSALSSQYEGSHRLIRDGACIVSSAPDVVRQLGLELSGHLDLRRSGVENAHSGAGSKGQRSASESVLLSYIGAESTPMDDIIRGSGLTAAEVSSILLALELDGAIAIASDGGYVNLA